VSCTVGKDEVNGVMRKSRDGLLERPLPSQGIDAPVDQFIEGRQGAAFGLSLLLLLFGSQAWAAPFAYITNGASNNVTVIDTATNTVVGAPIAVGAGPFGIAVNQTGTRVYVTNFFSDSVSVIDTATNTVVGTPIAVGSTPPVSPSTRQVHACT
jgi:YVTN family beta-propeller protein